MDFGKVSVVGELNRIDFSLAADHPQTTRILSNSKAGQLQVFVGCAKWGRAEWVGKFYPKGTKAGNYLDEYAKQVNCVEYNAIFYRLPTLEEIRKWKEKIGKDFIFCPKFTQAITHFKRLKNVEKELDEYYKTIYEFGPHLGPVFLMPEPRMGPKHLDDIVSFIEKVPQDIDLFVEFRQPDWYTQPHYDTMFDSLEKMKKGAIITDTAGRRDCVHMRLTTPDAFIRFVGNSLHKSDYTRIDEWVERIYQWQQQGLQRCYFFMHQHDETYSPELCKYLIEKLNAKCNLSIPVPKFYNGGGLF